MIPGSWTFQQDLLNDVTSSQTYQFTFYELRILIISNVVGISSGDLINVEVWSLNFEVWIHIWTFFHILECNFFHQNWFATIPKFRGLIKNLKKKFLKISFNFFSHPWVSFFSPELVRDHTKIQGFWKKKFEEKMLKKKFTGILVRLYHNSWFWIIRPHLIASREDNDGVVPLTCYKGMLDSNLTANIFESGPMSTPWKFLAGPPLLPSSKLG